MFLDLTNVKADEFKSQKIKPGPYLVRCAEAVVKATKKGGKLINCKFRFVDEDKKGLSFYHSFNIENESAKAQQIGLSQLKSFMEAAGNTTGQLEHVTDLEGMTATAQIGYELSEGKEYIKAKYFIAKGNEKTEENLFS